VFVGVSCFFTFLSFFSEITTLGALQKEAMFDDYPQAVLDLLDTKKVSFGVLSSLKTYPYKQLEDILKQSDAIKAYLNDGNDLGRHRRP
jgi:hypothetical protein